MSHYEYMSSSSSEEEEEEEEEVPVESLIKGREKRSTAGRQMSALLDAEADDELALLFEEVDDDNEFAADIAEVGGEEDDMGLESSSDDDDQGPNAQADDFEGEQQIQKEEKEEKKKKRAQEDLRYRITSKKVKIDPTAAPKVPTGAPPRQRKKSERVSWIPTVDEGPTRSSSRRQTMQNKELTHARLKDSEEKRVRLIATMEEAAKRKAKHKPKSMTQAERLAEAERVEKHNSKSLNRWEEMEKRKAEERRAKIEALQNRRLEGPVISYWSGVATWADGRLTQVGKVAITPKPEKDDSGRKKSKKADKEGKSVTEQPASNTAAGPGVSQTTVPINPSENPTQPTTNAKQDQPTQSTQPAQQTTTGISVVIDPALEENHSETKNEASITSTQPISPTKGASEDQLPASTPSAFPEADAAASVPKENAEVNGDARVSSEQLAKATDSGATKGTAEETPDRPAAPNSTSQTDEVTTEENDQAPDAESSLKSEEKHSDVAQVSTPEPLKTTQTIPGVQSTSDPASELPVSSGPGLDQPGGTPKESPQVPAAIEQQPDIHIDEPNATTADSQPPAAAPAVIEHTGRFLTVLENFDDKTAQSGDFSIYFNAKKPPRLTSTWKSLPPSLVILSFLTLRQLLICHRNIVLTLCYHVTSITLPRPRYIPPIRKLLCIPRNSPYSCSKVFLEPYAWVLRWTRWYRRARRTCKVPRSQCPEREQPKA